MEEDEGIYLQVLIHEANDLLDVLHPRLRQGEADLAVAEKNFKFARERDKERCQSRAQDPFVPFAAP
jgi:hypothetical protein